MAKVFADAGNRVMVHARRDEVVDAINTRHENPRYFPGFRLPPGVQATTNTTFALSGAQYLLLSVPAQTLRANLNDWGPYIRPGTRVVSLINGIETDTGLRMSQVIHETWGVPFERIAVLSGPNLAREVANGQPAASVIACPDETAAAAVQEACHTPYFRPYTTTDVTAASSAAPPRTSSPSPSDSRPASAWATTPEHSSSPAASQRPPGSAPPSAPTRSPSPASPARATSSPPAPHPCPATGPSASTSARV